LNFQPVLIMAFKDILGHEKPIRLLQQAIKTDKVVHSYLFLGNEGIGKKQVALQFSKALNCLGEGPETGEACDHCLSCKKVDDGLHPDVLLLEPENHILKVEQVRQMQRDLAYRPYEGRRRVCIIAAADRMAPNMSNSLLKTLEEPPLHTVIILLANNPRLLLPTILSRCQAVRFNPLPASLVTQWLVEEKGFNADEAHLLASLSEGSPGRALALQEELKEIPRVDLLKGWLGVRSLSLEDMEQWAESLPSDRERLVSVLEVGKTLLRDLVMVKAVQDPSKLIHGDLREKMEPIAAQWDLSVLLNRIDVLHQTLLAVSPGRGNANTKLALEAMMLSWAQG
jgi:DNA polymerase-3 subunit delta'